MQIKNEALRKRHEEIEADKRAALGQVQSARCRKEECKLFSNLHKRKSSQPTVVGGVSNARMCQLKQRVKEKKHDAHPEVSESTFLSDIKLQPASNPNPLTNDSGQCHQKEEKFVMSKRNYDLHNDPMRIGKLDGREGRSSHRCVRNYGGVDFNNTLLRMDERRQRCADERTPYPKSNREFEMVMNGRERINHSEWVKEREQFDMERATRYLLAGPRPWDLDKIDN
ncbi:PREDICTED: uncharacterized protein LOC106812977 isoform X1 [Priapulus caudatus]|uniref:Uncharacterized protein LOC106812977 isoform X1 n=1 Tax=Priapulus caudatus TaxID=37621 RepID=A0ABM1EJX5_PRICU|nr:PREDICTED: uncharacterized protein LOC106812977 isoform X1 [Priapulus caudatus]